MKESYTATKQPNGSYLYRGFLIERLDDPYDKWWVSIVDRELKKKQMVRLGQLGKAARLHNMRRTLKSAKAFIDSWLDLIEKEGQ